MPSSSDSERNNYVVYGGQYGSEGKASIAESLAKEFSKSKKPLVVFGENSPNSGHTSSKGSTRNLPASSFWADVIILGPDSVVDPEVLIKDWKKVGEKKLFIHENAALVDYRDSRLEKDLVKRISSTGSGSGMARKRKFIDRNKKGIVKVYAFPNGIETVSTEGYLNVLSRVRNYNKIFECSQGVLLDTNFGLFPFVTSRTTLPRAVIARNGLSAFEWTYLGVYRTYPIRTGGPSGPTGGEELDWEFLGLKSEQATVTKRLRRVFEFSREDFLKSVHLSQPDKLVFTFIDYLDSSFDDWLDYHEIFPLIKRYSTWLSSKTGKMERFVPQDPRAVYRREPFGLAQGST